MSEEQPKPPPPPPPSPPAPKIVKPTPDEYQVQYKSLDKPPEPPEPAAGDTK